MAPIPHPNQEQQTPIPTQDDVKIEAPVDFHYLEYAFPSKYLLNYICTNLANNDYNLFLIRERPYSF